MYRKATDRFAAMRSGGFQRPSQMILKDSNATLLVSELKSDSRTAIDLLQVLRTRNLFGQLHMDRRPVAVRHISCALLGKSNSMYDQSM